MAKSKGYGVAAADRKLQAMFTNQKANIIATRKLDRRDRMSEYKATQSLTKSLYGNALGTLGGVAKNMTADQARQLRALKRVTSGKAEGRISERAADTVRNLYGIAGTGYAGPALDTLAAQAKGAKTTLQGQRKAGGILAESNDAAMSTLAAGLQESKQGAKAAVANALLYRAKNDASLISAQKTALAQARIGAAADERNARLQAELDFQNWKKQQDYANKSVGQGAGQVAQVAGDAFSGLRTISNTWYDAQGKPVHGTLDAGTEHTDDPQIDGVSVHALTAGQAAAQYATDQGYAAGSPEYTVIQATARAMWNAGAGAIDNGPFHANEAVQVRTALTSAFATLYPSMKPAKLTDLIGTYVQSLDSAGGVQANQNTPYSGSLKKYTDERKAGDSADDIIAEMKAAGVPSDVIQAWAKVWAKEYHGSYGVTG